MKPNLGESKGKIPLRELKEDRKNVVINKIAIRFKRKNPIKGIERSALNQYAFATDDEDSKGKIPLRELKGHIITSCGLYSF